MKIVDATNGRSHPYAPHLRIRGFSVAPGKEWSPQLSGWSFIQVGSGTGYWLQEQWRTELESGTVLLVAGAAHGRVLASCLNCVALHTFTVLPERLTGLVTQGEQDIFKRAAARKDFHQVLPPHHSAAQRMRELCLGPNQDGLLFRLALLQLVIEAFGKELEQAPANRMHADVKERLRGFLQETPPADLLEISFDELARVTHCTPRHLSRVFSEVVGMPFRDKRAEIRLARARELLATSESKVVDVAFKSGYKSLSLFNRMFTRRFGISPGRWRQKNGGVKDLPGQRQTKARLLVNDSRFKGF